MLQKSPGSDILTVGVLLALLAGSVVAQTSTVSDAVSVTLVEIPVVVLDKGTPVRDLTADDFVLLGDGVEQTIESFEKVDLSLARADVPAEEAEPISLAARRYFLLAFDLAHTQPTNARRAVEAARELIGDGLHPTDLVGVSIYSAVAGARLLHPFTSDHRELESALLAVEAVVSRQPEVVEKAKEVLESEDGGAAEDLYRFLSEIRAFTTQQGVGLESTIGPAGEWLPAVDASGRGGALMTEILAEMEADYQQNIANVVRDRSLDLLETLGALASALEEIRGQKYFVLFSEGIDETVFENPFDTRDGRQLRAIMESFRRSGWSVHAIDVGRSETRTRGMFLLASETGGQEYRNFTSLDEAMTAILNETSVSYVLRFQPRELEPDGRYHSIEVKLKAPHGRIVKYRKGYFAPDSSGQEMQDALVARAAQVASLRADGPFKVNLMATTFKQPGVSALVPTILEIDGPELLAGQEEPLLELDVEIYLVDRDAGAIPLSTRRLALDTEFHGELIRSGGIKVLDDLLLGPGAYRLRAVVSESQGDRRSVADRSIVVPDFGEGQPRLLEPIFPEVSARWLVVRQPDAGSSESSRFPFQFAGRKFMPRAAVNLGSGETVPVCLMAFDLPENEPHLGLEILNAAGVEPEGGRLVLASAPERLDEGLYRVMAQLETTDLPEGDYQIRVKYQGGGGGAEIAATRNFKIRPTEK